MYTLNCRGKLFIIDRPVVMGIINTTPDSFFEGSREQELDKLVEKAAKMIAEGASILDIGGQSTRPGAELVPPGEEEERVLPAIKAIAGQFPEVIISIDTFYANVAGKAVNAGASIINDVSGGLFDKDMLQMVSSLQVPFICMHHQGIPVSKQHFEYENLTRDIIDFFIERIKACREAGIKDIIIDPGFGFGKNSTQNFQLLKQLEMLKIFQLPVLAGLSRKSTIYKTLGITAADALNGSTVMHTIALLNGASILRVHDVKEAMEAVKLLETYKGS
jgi:dihydropteroate synthase